MEILVPIAIVIAVLIASGLRIAQEYERAIVFRLGRYQGTKGPGLYWIIPMIDRQQTIDIRTKTVDLEQQETITKDSVTIKVNAVLWFRVTNPENAVIKIANYNRYETSSASIISMKSCGSGNRSMPPFRKSWMRRLSPGESKSKW